MQLWRSWDDVPSDLGSTAVVIGNFDGVHLGHRQVLARARTVADEREDRKSTRLNSSHT